MMLLVVSVGEELRGTFAGTARVELLRTI